VVPPRGAARLQRFFLAETPEAGVARLEPDEEHHVRKVLRMGEGDRLLGMDGGGRAWLLEIRAAARGHLELLVLAEEAREAEPGTAGSSAPHLHLACSLPRGRRSEELVERAIQLGLSLMTPLVLAHTPSRSPGFAAERFVRLARAACKQSARAWLPELGPPTTLEDLLARPPKEARFLLVPEAPRGLAELVARARESGHDRLLLIVGPEGGFDARELAFARTAGVQDAALVPAILRIETAAEAALAIAAHAWSYSGL
jgi:16S rRNA (uracil1498-N3)-methyltransferase